MIRALRLPLLLVVVSPLGCLARSADPVRQTTVPAVSRIFVESLGSSADAASARAQLIERIAERERFEVVYERGAADAVLRGAIGVRLDRSVWPHAARGHGMLTLESARTGRVMWRATYDRWNPTDPAAESVPDVALQRAVVFFDQALHRADRLPAPMVARQPNDD